MLCDLFQEEATKQRQSSRDLLQIRVAEKHLTLNNTYRIGRIMTTLSCYVAILSFLAHLTGADFASGLQALCGDMLSRPVSYKVQVMCDDIATFMNKLQRENELEPYAWLPSIRNSRDTSSAESALNDKPSLFSVRTRRGGNYIRFGRSVPSLPSQTSYLKSFGERDTRSDGHYVRFGRSIPDNPMLAENDIDKEEEKRFMRFGKSGNGALIDGKDKKFMRFGRDPTDDDRDDKRFMRFGKKDTSSLGEVNDKRFMRFGKRDHDSDDDKEDEKRFMRFGRGGIEDVVVPTSDKRFMRFGKREGLIDDLGALDYESAGKRFMRFGKSTSPDVDDKRFMRFGKSLDENMDEDKRFMRFGKRFMRFGRKPGSGQALSVDADDLVNDKRFMRFGKRDWGQTEGQNPMYHSVLLEGTNNNADKRFMRFGKKSVDDSKFEDDKRFMRFGKRSATKP